MSESPLSIHAGPIAVIAGGLFAVAHLGQFVVMDRSNLSEISQMPPSKPPPPAFSTSYALSKFRMQRPAQAWLCGRPKAERLRGCS